jgi:hypothetical protein
VQLTSEKYYPASGNSRGSKSEDDEPTAYTEYDSCKSSQHDGLLFVDTHDVMSLTSWSTEDPGAATTRTSMILNGHVTMADQFDPVFNGIGEWTVNFPEIPESVPFGMHLGMHLVIEDEPERGNGAY